MSATTGTRTKGSVIAQRPIKDASTHKRSVETPAQIVTVLAKLQAQYWWELQVARQEAKKNFLV